MAAPALPRLYTREPIRIPRKTPSCEKQIFFQLIPYDLAVPDPEKRTTLPLQWKEHKVDKK